MFSCHIRNQGCCCVCFVVTSDLISSVLVLHQWFNTSCIQESNLAGVIRKALDQVRDLCEDNADAESDSDMV
jgi:hypothetical protein